MVCFKYFLDLTVPWNIRSLLRAHPVSLARLLVGLQCPWLLPLETRAEGLLF